MTLSIKISKKFQLSEARIAIMKIYFLKTFVTIIVKISKKMLSTKYPEFCTTFDLI